MNESINRLELTEEQLEVIVGGTGHGSSGFSSTFTNNPILSNWASADQTNVVLNSCLDNSSVGGSTIKQQNPFSQNFTFSFPQQSNHRSW
jgi:hypothetical protein